MEEIADPIEVERAAWEKERASLLHQIAQANFAIVMWRMKYAPVMDRLNEGLNILEEATRESWATTEDHEIRVAELEKMSRETLERATRLAETQAETIRQQLVLLGEQNELIQNQMETIRQLRGGRA